MNQIKTWTRRDPVLSQGCELVTSQFPVEIPTTSPLRPYWLCMYELSVENCVLWGNRVVMPPPDQSAVLSELHKTHSGVSRMKALVQSYVYWTNLDHDIEQLAKGCQTCQVHRTDPAGVPLHPWEWPSRPWYRVHEDFLGPFLGKDFLLLIGWKCTTWGALWRKPPLRKWRWHLHLLGYRFVWPQTMALSL